MLTKKRLHSVALRDNVLGLQNRAEFFNQLRVCRRNGEVVHMCAEEDLFPRSRTILNYLNPELLIKNIENLILSLLNFISNHISF